MIRNAAIFLLLTSFVLQSQVVYSAEHQSSPPGNPEGSAPPEKNKLNKGKTSKDNKSDEWGDWDKEQIEVPIHTKYGVGIVGKDEHLLNTLDSSSLLDYDEAPSKERKVTKKGFQQKKQLDKQSESKKSIDRKYEEKLQHDAEYLFIRTLEEKILDDLGS